MFEDFTDEELDGAKAIAKAGPGDSRSVEKILAALEKMHTETERLNTASTKVRRSQLVNIYELLWQALSKDEDAQRAFGSGEEEVFTETGGKLLNGIIKRHTGLSKQRACCLAMVLRYALYSKIAQAEFPDWLGAKENLDQVAREYTAVLGGESTEDPELRAKLGDGWDKLAPTLEKVHETGKVIPFRARLKCGPGGKVHFVRKLFKPKK